jgi:serine-type D-Ala-D-Ala carboxypeptidase (penicillin-binding protein 5/6)
MKGLIVRRGRLCTVLVFLAVLGVTISTMVGVAWGTATTTSRSSAVSQSNSFTIRAADLGDFSGKPPSIKSASAIVINMTTGKVLYEHNAHTVMPMASTTKIMTATLVLENMDLSKRVTISANAVNTIEPVPIFKEGDVFTVEQLLYAMMLRSVNSAAVALAEGCSGTVQDFVALMNKKAAELGMSNTNFVNPNGIDKKGHDSTAADMAVLARYAMRNDTFRKIVSTKTYSLVLPGRGTITCKNTNELLHKYSWITGVKTGLTPQADKCFVGAGTKDGVNVISVILGQPVPAVCFAESKALLLYGFTQYRYLDLMQKGAVVAAAEVPYQLDGRLQLVTADAVHMELFKDQSVTTSVVIDKPLKLPVQAGDVYGKVTLTVDGKVVGKVDLVAAQSYGKVSLGGKVAYYWRRLGRGLGRVF